MLNQLFHIQQEYDNGKAAKCDNIFLKVR